MKLRTIYAHLDSELKTIEKTLEKTVFSSEETLQEASTQLLKAGGKRIRPIFVLLSGRFGSYDRSISEKVAVSLEMIHMASLVHDDVVDDAKLRRGQETVKSKWDNRIAMYTGDYIFAKSLELMTEIESVQAHQRLAYTIVEVCKGELEQVREKFDWEQSMRVYLRRIRRKTALLIAASCQLGALANDAPIDAVRALYRFGYNVGMAYQITDDVLDFTGTEKQLGKPAGSDLAQGNITLPVLYAIQNPEVKQHLRHLIAQHTSESVNQAVNVVLQSGGIRYSEQLSDRYLQKALTSLEVLPNTRAKKTLKDIAEYIGRRRY
ncbi:heptaprenyl diphosphate synthase component II [Bacillaceae bacterium SIJ1]|uniref:heptaprenyl diphosphate synthase component II n=1 Tax=Litoribacterium kuwaitense TaxID=1398745 RepID=UPI0013EB00A5|nr:heptaprenyl diphosphate synthase component II [Litoribacterium kuwaitense]NGP43705.1 heptaprenyl diphosphate synthase component II [Litoribacterium kuwaitense]